LIGNLTLGIPAIANFGAGSRCKTALSTFALPTEVYKGSVGKTIERRHKNCTRGRPREGIKSCVTLNEYSFQPLQEVPMLSVSLVLGLSVRDWGTTSESVVGVIFERRLRSRVMPESTSLRVSAITSVNAPDLGQECWILSVTRLSRRIL
jgi:hypothetical protein